MSSNALNISDSRGRTASAADALLLCTNGVVNLLSMSRVTGCKSRTRDDFKDLEGLDSSKRHKAVRPLNHSNPALISSLPEDDGGWDMETNALEDQLLTKSPDSSLLLEVNSQDSSQTCPPANVNSSNVIFSLSVNTRKGPSTVHRYSNNLKGECNVLIQRDPTQKDAKKPLSDMPLARLFNSTYKGAIKDVKENVFAKVTVFLHSAKAANKLLDDSSLQSRGLIAFIPANFVTCQGVIRDIPLDFTLDEIKDNMEVLGFSRGEISVLEVRRLTRKVIDKITKKQEIVPSRSILLSFKGTTLPDRIAIYRASAVVHRYNPPVQCHKCWRFGHVSSQCRSGPRCVHCGGPGDHSANNPCPCALPKTPKCANCSGSHLATSRDCLEFQF